MEEAGIEGWAGAQRGRKWRWAGHVARLRERRWTQLALYWTPSGRRGVGRFVKTWEKDLEHFYLRHKREDAWIKCAASRNEWKAL